MDQEALLDEVGRQLDIWASSYKNATESAKKIAEIDAARIVEEEKHLAYLNEQEMAANTVNELIADVPEDSDLYYKITELSQKKVSPVLMSQVIR